MEPVLLQSPVDKYTVQIDNPTFNKPSRSSTATASLSSCHSTSSTRSIFHGYRSSGDTDITTPTTSIIDFYKDAPQSRLSRPVPLRQENEARLGVEWAQASQPFIQEGLPQECLDLPLPVPVANKSFYKSLRRGVFRAFKSSRPRVAVDARKDSDHVESYYRSTSSMRNFRPSSNKTAADAVSFSQATTSGYAKSMRSNKSAKSRFSLKTKPISSTAALTSSSRAVENIVQRRKRAHSFAGVDYQPPKILRGQIDELDEITVEACRGASNHSTIWYIDPVDED